MGLHSTAEMQRSAAIAWAEVAKLLQERGLSARPGHTIMRSGGTIWCISCGTHGTDKDASIPEPCTGDPTRRWTESCTVVQTFGREINLLLLKGGRHPDTRVSPPPAVAEAEWNTYPAPVPSTPAGRGGASRTTPRVDILSWIRQKEAGFIDPHSVMDRPAKGSRLEIATEEVPPPLAKISATMRSQAAPVARESLAVAATMAQRRTQGIAVAAGLKRSVASAFGTETNNCNRAGRQHQRRRQAGGVSTDD